MHIVHVTQCLGGVEIYICNAINACAAEDNKTSFTIFAPRDFRNNLKSKNVDFFHWSPRRHINPFSDIFFLFKLIHKLKKLPGNSIVHCHSAKGGVLGRIAGKITGFKTVYTPHAFSFFSAQNSYVKFFYKFIERIMVPFTDILIATSESERKRALINVKIPSAKVITWTNSIYFPEKSTNEYKITDKKYICTVARPCYQKNLDMLVRVISIITKKSEIKCIILGIGHYSPETRHLINLIKEYNIEDKIELIEWLDRKEVLQMIANSTLYVSTSRYEGLPLSILEAMGLGKACVVTDVDGNRDCIENGKTGAIVQLNNDEAMAEVIIELLLNEKKRKKMEKAAIERFNKFFNLEITGRDLFRMYQNVNYTYFQ